MDWQPAVVLSDIGLPELNGYEVARRLRQEPHFEKVLLVALTGYSGDDDRQRSKDAGFDYHLVKPADVCELQRLLTARSCAPSLTAASRSVVPAKTGIMKGR